MQMVPLPIADPVETTGHAGMAKIMDGLHRTVPDDIHLSYEGYKRSSSTEHCRLELETVLGKVSVLYCGKHVLCGGTQSLNTRSNTWG